jgi:phenylpropionate dioxygenase-like ring-hydroxylating dioxygenase large terminal subunit
MPAETSQVSNPAAPDPDADWSLPAWLYHDVEYHAVEMQRVLRPSWQIVCHESDIADIGAYQTLDFLGENILVIRGDDQVVRAFTNVCRHRASRLLDGLSGCVRKITCPYHAWTYDLNGQLTGVPMKNDYQALDMSHHGLVPVDMELWHGFIFVRLETGGPSVADMLAPYAADVEPYQFSNLRALGRVTLRPRAVNWKNVGDNYSDGLHISVAHPGLSRLFGRSYGIEAQSHADKMWGYLVDRESANISERMYQKYLPTVPHLPQNRQRLWTYVKLWPNIAFDIYPDQVDFMQFLPISSTETLIREISYAIPDNRREMRVARYLNWRINRQVNSEDTVLISRVQQGMMSPSYTVGPIGSSEVCLRSFARKIRDLVPEARLHRPPAAGWSRFMQVKAVS